MDSTDIADQTLDEARRLASAGRYQEALEKHIWYHRHALEYGPSHAGVRLSFALNDWVELGRKYPPALEALSKIRDEGESELASGKLDEDLFYDVVSINKFLNATERSVQLFEKIAGEHPQFAAKAYPIVEEDLLRHGKHVSFSEHIGNHRARFRELKQDRDRKLRLARDMGLERMSSHADKMFRQHTSELVKLLRDAGREDDAAWVEEQAERELGRQQ